MELVKADNNTYLLPRINEKIFFCPYGQKAEILYTVIDILNDRDGVVTQSGYPAIFVIVEKLAVAKETETMIVGFQKDYQRIDNKHHQRENIQHRKLVDEALKLYPNNKFVQSVDKQLKDKKFLSIGQIDALRTTINTAKRQKET